MSKRHQATRRRAYGRRQHELHQREDQAFLMPWRESEEPRDPGREAERLTSRDGQRTGLTFGYGD